MIGKILEQNLNQVFIRNLIGENIITNSLKGLQLLQIDMGSLDYWSNK